MHQLDSRFLRLKIEPLPMALAALGSMVLLLHARRYLPFIPDDALISLRYSKRLIDGRGLTWTDGERVEGYSNLLWVVSCALMGRFGLDLIDAARILGCLAMIAVVTAVVLAAGPSRLRDAPPALFGSLVLAATGPIAVWAIGAMEIALLSALLAWALVLGYRLVLLEKPAQREIYAPSLLLALICITRPDGVLFAVAACVGLIWARGLNRQALIIVAQVAGLPAAFCLAQLGFRLYYYGEWVPNSVLAKASFSSRRLTEAVQYFAKAYSTGGILVPAVVALVLARRRLIEQRIVKWLIVPFVAWTAEVLLIGGDNFPAFRHLVPQVVIAVLLGVETIHYTLRKFGSSRTAVVIVFLWAVLAAMQWRDPENVSAVEERWEWEGEVVGKLLKDAFGNQQALLAVDPAGSLPYFSELPSLDMLGLNDRYLAHHHPPQTGEGELGHEMGDGKYVLGRNPDLVIVCAPSGEQPVPGAPGKYEACFLSGKQLFADPEFKRRYQLVVFEGRRPFAFQSRVRVRREEGRIGVQRTTNQIVIPGFLFAGRAETPARLDDTGRIAVVSHGDSLLLRNLGVPPGEWQLLAECSPSPTAITVRAGQSENLGQGHDGTAFRTSPTSGTVDIEVIPMDRLETWLHRIVLTRIGEVAASTTSPR